MGAGGAKKCGLISSRSSSSRDALSIGEQVEQRSVVLPPVEEEKVDSGDSDSEEDSVQDFEEEEEICFSFVNQCASG